MQKFSNQVSLTASYKVSIMDANNGNKKSKTKPKKQNQNKIRTNDKSCT